MDLQEAIDVVEQKLGRSLRDVERHIFWGSWHGMTYDEMAKQTYDAVKYEPNYLKGDIGHKFWSQLSEALGEKVSKRNFKGTIEKLVKSQNETVLSSMIPILDDDYVSRPKIDAIAERNVLKQGSLLRIKGSPKMGKTTVLSHLIKIAEQEGYKGIVVSMREVSEDATKSLDNFLYWFCLTVSGELRLQREFAEFNWNKQLGQPKQKATWYFEDHILSESRPIVLGLDELGKLFINHDIAEGFFNLLRTWHENAKRDPLWSCLNLILVYTTEYQFLDLRLSPFNLGIPIHLEEFTKEQIKELSLKYGGNLSDSDIDELLSFIGGHPYLVKLTLEYVDQVNTIEQIRKQAEQDGGIYQDFLKEKLQIIEMREDEEEIKRILKDIINGKDIQDKDMKQILDLEDLGVIRRVNHHAEMRCQLYQFYLVKYL